MPRTRVCGSPTSKSRHCPDAARSVVPGEAGACHKCDWAYCMLRESRSTRASLTMCYLCAPVPHNCSAAWASGHGHPALRPATAVSGQARCLRTVHSPARHQAAYRCLPAFPVLASVLAGGIAGWLSFTFLPDASLLAGTGGEWCCRCCRMAEAAVPPCAAGAVSSVGNKAA